MLSLYSAKAIALQIRFRRIRMERPRRGGAYDVRYFFNDPPLRFHVAGTKASSLWVLLFQSRERCRAAGCGFSHRAVNRA